MDKIIETLRKPSGAMSLGRVLVFLFGLEALLLTPYILIVGKENAVYVVFLVFFAFLFCALIFNKVVDSKYISISTKEGDKK